MASTNLFAYLKLSIVTKFIFPLLTFYFFDKTSETIFNVNTVMHAEVESLIHWCYTSCIIIIIIVVAHQHKAAGVKTEAMLLLLNTPEMFARYVYTVSASSL